MIVTERYDEQRVRTFSDSGYYIKQYTRVGEGDGTKGEPTPFNELVEAIDIVDNGNIPYIYEETTKVIVVSPFEQQEGDMLDREDMNTQIIDDYGNIENLG